MNLHHAKFSDFSLKMVEPVVKRSALMFKGEKPARKTKRKLEGSDDLPRLMKDHPESVEYLTGDGRVLDNGFTLQGMETNFKDQVRIGDVIVIRHPQTLRMEERAVTSILSQRSLNIHQPFSSDFVSTTEFKIRKIADPDKTKNEVKSEEPFDNEMISGRDKSADGEGQKQLQDRLSREKNVFTYQEKSGSWHYKTVSVEVDKNLTQEDLLDMKCRKVHDKYC